MELVVEKKTESSPKRPIFLICVFRDEDLLLEYFIQYYHSLGVTHFIMIDNGSTDLGPSYLASLENINLMLYSTEESYRDAEFGTQWVNDLLQEHCIGQFCFTVDVDELFRFDSRKYGTLHDLVSAMESSGHNVVPSVLLDMYPEKTNNHYRRGQDFLTHSPYFDEFNETHYEIRAKIYDSFSFLVGGVRNRLFGVKPCIQKMPFFRYDFPPLAPSAGYHFFQENGKVLLESDLIRPHQDPGVLLHFKFIKPQFQSFIEQRVERNEDWNDSSEYRAYLEALRGDKIDIQFYDNRYSKPLTSNQVLDVFFSSFSRRTNAREELQKLRE